MMDWQATIKTSGPVRFGLLRLVSQYPLYATLIDNWRVLEDMTIPTMAVRLGGDLRIELSYNSDFAISITPDELVNVLLHEVLHVVFRHPNMKRERYPNYSALVIAQEVTVNEQINGPLPGEPLRLKNFPNLPLCESTRKRYHRLENVSLDKEAITTTDNHKAWEVQSAENEDLADMLDAVVEGDLTEALSSLPQEIQTEEIEKLFLLAKQIPGNHHCDSLIRISGGGIPKTNWSSILRSFIWRMSQPQPTFKRPSRRLRHLVGIVAGRTRMPGRPKVMAVLDTSGSMITDSILSTLRSEIQSLSALTDILVVECDTKIQREYEFKGDLEQVRGGGGTSFIKPLEPEFISKRRVDAVMYFTDGFGSAPTKPPSVPLIWCLLGMWARKPAQYGRVVRVNVSSQESVDESDIPWFHNGGFGNVI